tara:strand:+ start:206 stop:427 length:222 start_codon:yes stop_codon:yes gene_type:complete
MSAHTDNERSEAAVDAPRLVSHSQMLGQIAAVVGEWCIDEECTTLDAVKLAVADCRKWRGIAERYDIEQKYPG